MRSTRSVPTVPACAAMKTRIRSGLPSSCRHGSRRLTAVWRCAALPTKPSGRRFPHTSWGRSAGWETTGSWKIPAIRCWNRSLNSLRRMGKPQAAHIPRTTRPAPVQRRSTPLSAPCLSRGMSPGCWTTFMPQRWRHNWKRSSPRTCPQTRSAGFGKDGFGPGQDFVRPDDFYIRMIANIHDQLLERAGKMQVKGALLFRATLRREGADGRPPAPGRNGPDPHGAHPRTAHCARRTGARRVVAPLVPG